MLRWLVVLALAGCTRATGLEAGAGKDLSEPDGLDASLVDAAGTDAGGFDLADAPAWHSQTSNTTAGLRGIWGSSANDVYAVGAQGTILHSSGDGNWTQEVSGTSQNLYAIWGSSSHDLYAAGDVLLRSSGDGNWQTDTSAPSGLMGVWGSAGDDVYVAGLFGVSHSTGDGSWAADSQAEPWGGYFHVRGPSASNVFAVGGLINLNDPSAGGGVAELANGNWSWTRLSAPDEMKDIVFTARGAFIVGLSGQIWTQATSGGAWTEQASPVPWDLQAVWADDAGELYAVGGSGTVMVSGGDGTWTAQAPLFELDLWGVWGSSANDIYAVGDDGHIFHFN